MGVLAYVCQEEEMTSYPAQYFTDTAGLTLDGRGKWRTAACGFHGGSDSMRINISNGAWVCMAGCGARGGDVLAYHMAAQGMEFVEAAKSLGAWAAGGVQPNRQRPAALSPRYALEVLALECILVAISATNIANGVQLSNGDRERLHLAAARISRIAGDYKP